MIPGVGLLDAARRRGRQMTRKVLSTACLAVTIMVTAAGCVPSGGWVPNQISPDGQPVTWCGPVTWAARPANPADSTFRADAGRALLTVTVLSGRRFVEVPFDIAQVKFVEVWPAGGGSEQGFTSARSDGRRYLSARVSINPAGTVPGTAWRWRAVLHEVGHVAGLGHTDVFDSLMNVDGPGYHGVHVDGFRPVDVDGLRALAADSC